MASNRPRFLPVAAMACFAATMAPAVLAQADTPMPNPPEFPFENPMLTDQDVLGKFLFWEEQISTDNTMACGTCHIHEAGGADPRAVNKPHPGPDGIFGTDDDIAGSRGIVRQDAAAGQFVHSDIFGSGVQSTNRKAPTAINAPYFNQLFWDGRATEAYTDPQSGLVEIGYLGALESQAAGPPVSDVEMGGVNRTWDAITAKLADVTPMALATNLPAEMLDFLADNPTYPDMFEAVYGDPTITSKRVMFAIGNYERTLISDETVLDAFLKGEIQDFTGYDPKMQAGFELFQGNANCAACHVLPFTMDNDFHNVGVRPDAEDHGRFDVTGDPADMGRFKTPNIRNAKLRTPLFHNGAAASVPDLIDFYSRGGDFDDGNLDPNLLVLDLTQDEKDALIFFIEEGLTDPRVEAGTFPFNRPTLHSELPPLNTTYGVASADGNGGFAQVIDTHPANLGNGDFLLGVSDAVPNTGAVLVFAFDDDPAGTPYPDPRFPVPVNVDLGTILLTAAMTTDADGIATYNLPIPKNPVLSGFLVYGQWFIADPTALATGGVYGTEGVAITIL
ncbi:MAG: hypothetical protein H6825_02515 [Planctomycetes bacterium]|nr:hypothetical protein [Planctomycetota bacterium]